MRVSRSEPGFVVSSAVHAGLLVAALVLFSDAKKFDDVQEMIPVEVVTDSQLSQIAKGEKSARETKPAPRVDKVAPASGHKPHPPLAEAKKDIPSPPPPLRRSADPGVDDKPEPTPPKRIAALPPAPEPPTRPQPENKVEKPAPPKPQEAKPAEQKPAPTPPAKPKPATREEKPAPRDEKAATPEEKEEPKEAEVVKPKPPTRPRPEKEAKETPAPKPAPKPVARQEPEKPRAEPRLKTDEVAKLLESRKPNEKAAKPENPEGEAAEKKEKGAKPKSGDETAPKSMFDAASISKLLSREAPQRTAATGKETRTAALGAPEGAEPKLSASMEARIASYIHDHYHPCWASALSLGGATYAPVVEFHLSREGALEGRPRLLNATSSPTEKARGEQALQAVRRCSPMKIPAEFMPYYEEALHEVTIRFQDSN